MNVLYQDKSKENVTKKKAPVMRMYEKTTEEKNEEELEVRELNWEVLEPKKVERKVRKPVVLKHFFGDESGAEESVTDSSEDEKWEIHDPEKKNKEKKKRQKDKKKLRQMETATKARAMLGVGPVTRAAIEHHENLADDKKTARKNAVEDFLRFHLEFNREELDELDIRETSVGKDDCIYFAVGNADMLKEIHFRKSDSRNDDIFIRNFVPPQFHARYMYISKTCGEKRKMNQDLKTQMRFGHNDIEVFVKTKGSNEPFKKVELIDFLDTSELPKFDHTLSWKVKDESTRRRTIQYRNRPVDKPAPRTAEPAERKNEGEMPTGQIWKDKAGKSKENTESPQPPIQRQSSNQGIRDGGAKKVKLDGKPSEQELDSSKDEDMGEDLNDESYNTPNGKHMEK